jgi:hypothetical protein
LAEFAELWLADTVKIYNPQEANALLGGYGDDFWLVVMWWD